MNYFPRGASAQRALSKSSGFTLVELLVGLVLSLLIGGIALTYMVSSSRTFRIQTNDSITQENARFAMEIVAQNLRLAGMNPNNTFSSTLDVIYNGIVCPDSEDSIANGDNDKCTVDSLENDSDRIAVDYIAAESFTGCNFSNVIIPVGAEKRFANVFWTADIDGDGVRSLYCQTYNITDEQIEGAAAPLIDGVDRIQVQYGLDTPEPAPAPDPDAPPGTPPPEETFDGVVNQYVSYSNMAPKYSANVKSVRIALLVGSGAGLAEDRNSEDTEERDYQLLDGSEVTLTDRVQREIYSTTIMLPNAL